MAWGGALVVGLSIARGATVVLVSRVRRAGFEMLWRKAGRVQRIARGESLAIEAELRNRDSRAVRYTDLRVICAPSLEASIEPRQAEVPAGGRLAVTVTVVGRRVGRHGIHGLSLEVQGGPGLFEVPLTFANPYGVEVEPRIFALLRRSARGGRSRLRAADGRAGALNGDGTELRELRAHQPGDPFKRIAWKASARRGQLLVRELERDERDVVWCVLDCSAEHWSGALGRSPLDLAIDEVAATAERHLSLGDRVGLLVVGARVLARTAPERGTKHLVRLLADLTTATGCMDHDRSALDESDAAQRVLEHMRPLDPGVSASLRSHDLDRIARRADKLRARAPFRETAVVALSRRDRSLRRYLLAFGVHAPAKLEAEQPRTDQQLALLLRKLPHSRPRPSLVYLWSTPVDEHRRSELMRVIGEFQRRRCALCFVTMRSAQSVAQHESGTVARAVTDAVLTRVVVAEERGERALRRLGVRAERLRPRLAQRDEQAPPESTGDR